MFSVYSGGTMAPRSFVPNITTATATTFTFRTIRETYTVKYDFSSGQIRRILLDGGLEVSNNILSDEVNSMTFTYRDKNNQTPSGTDDIQHARVYLKLRRCFDAGCTKAEEYELSSWATLRNVLIQTYWVSGE